MLIKPVHVCLESCSSPVLQFPVMAGTWLGLLKFWRASVKRGMVLSLYQLSARHSRSRESSASGGNINERCQVRELDTSLPVTVPAHHQDWGETSSELRTGEKSIHFNSHLIFRATFHNTIHLTWWQRGAALLMCPCFLSAALKH